MMKNFLMAMFFFAGVWSCTSVAQEKPGLTKMESADFQKQLGEPEMQLVDVRTPEEFAQGHIEGAVNLNFMAADFQKKLDSLEKDKPVMVYCAVGGRSGKAAALMNELGFVRVYDLTGGFNAWKQDGLPVSNH